MNLLKKDDKGKPIKATKDEKAAEYDRLYSQTLEETL